MAKKKVDQELYEKAQRENPMLRKVTGEVNTNTSPVSKLTGNTERKYDNAQYERAYGDEYARQQAINRIKFNNSITYKNTTSGLASNNNAVAATRNAARTASKSGSKTISGIPTSVPKSAYDSKVTNGIKTQVGSNVGGATKALDNTLKNIASKRADAEVTSTTNAGSVYGNGRNKSLMDTAPYKSDTYNLTDDMAQYVPDKRSNLAKNADSAEQYIAAVPKQAAKEIQAYFDNGKHNKNRDSKYFTVDYFNKIQNDFNLGAFDDVTTMDYATKMADIGDILVKYGMDEDTALFYAVNYETWNDIIKTNKAQEEYSTKLNDVSDTVKNYLDEYNAARDRESSSLLSEAKERFANFISGEKTDYRKSSDVLEDIKKYTGWDDDTAIEYAKMYQTVKETKETEDELNKVTKNIKEGGVGTSAAYTAQDLATFIPSALEGGKELLKQKSGVKNTNPYASGYQMMNTNTAIEQEVSKKINNPVGQFAYGVGMSTAKSLEAAALGGNISSSLGLSGAAARVAASMTTLPAFGVTAYQQSYKENMEKGLGEENAQKTALSSGLFEMLFEVVSLDKLNGLYQQGGKALLEKGIKGALKDVAVQAGIEGSEEGFTDLANWTADQIINGSYSEYQQLVAEVGEKEAKIQFAKQLGYDVAAGAVSGGLSAGAVNVSTLTKSVSQAKSLLKNTDMLETATNNALKMDSDSKAYKVATDYKNGKKLNVLDVADMVASASGENSVTQAVLNDLVDSGMSEKQAVSSINTIAEALATEDDSKLTEVEKEVYEKITDDNSYTFEKAASEVTNTALKAKSVEVENKKQAKEEAINQKNMEVDEAYASNDGKLNATTANGTDIEIQGFKEDSTDTVIAKADNKEIEVKVSDINLKNESGSYTNKVAQIYNRASILDDYKAANIAVQEYKGQDTESYIMLGRKALMAGQIMPNMTATEYANLPTVAPYVRLNNSNLSYVVRMFERGKELRKADVVRNKSEFKGNKKLGTFDDSKVNNKDAKGYKEFASIAKQVAKKLNVEISVNDDSVSSDGGNFLDSVARITINYNNSRDAVRTLIHEVGEFATSYNPSGMDELIGAVLTYMGSKNSNQLTEDLNGYAEAYKNSGLLNEQDKTISQAGDEYVYDFIAGTILNENGLNDFASFITSNYEASTGQKILNTFKAILDNLISFFKSIASDDKQLGTQRGRELAKEAESQAKEFRKMWMAAVESASKNLNAASTNEKASKVSTNEEVYNAVKEKVDSLKTKNSIELSEPIEKTDRLIAVHNLTRDKLFKTLQYEGIPMPSIAITKASLGWSNFGDYSYVFTMNTIDPKNKKNRIFAADAWTPTFPSIDIKLDSKKTNELTNLLYSINGRVPSDFYNRANSFTSSLEEKIKWGGVDGLIEEAKENPGMKALYLAGVKNTDIDVITTEVREEQPPQAVEFSKWILDNYNLDEVFSMNYEDMLNTVGKDIIRHMNEERAKENPDFKAADPENIHNSKIQLNFVRNRLNAARSYAVDNGVKIRTVEDYEAEKAFVNEKINMKEYTSWLNSIFDGIVEKTGVYNGKELFTSAGNRRTFEQLHLEVTAANIVKSMITQSEDGRTTGGFHGSKSVRAVAVDEIRTLKQLKDASDKIVTIDTDEYNAILDDIDKRLSNVITEIQTASEKNGHGSGNSLIDMDSIGETILETAYKNDPNEIYTKLNGYTWITTREQAKEISNIVQAIKDMPVNMFEAKPERVVDFNEGIVIIPNNADVEIRDLLIRKGVQFVEYEADNEDARKSVLNNMDGKYYYELGETKHSIELTEEDIVKHELDMDLMQIIEDSYKDAIDILDNGAKSLDNVFIDENEVEKMAKTIIKDKGSHYSAKELADNLMKVFAYMKDTKNVSYDVLLDVVKQVATPVIEEVYERDRSADTEWQAMREYLQNTKIALSPMQKNEVKYKYGGYNQFASKLFGVAKFSDSGSLLDTIWTELVDASNGMLDYNTADTDQPAALFDLIDSYRPKNTNFGMDIEREAYNVAFDIFAKFFEMQANENGSSKAKYTSDQLVKKAMEYRALYKKTYDEELKKQKEVLKKKKIDDLREVLKKRDELSTEFEKLKMAEGEDLDPLVELEVNEKIKNYDETIQKIKDQDMLALAKANARKVASKHKYDYAEARRRTALSNSLKSNVKFLQGLLGRPKNKQFIPTEMVQAVIDVVSSINLDTGKSKATAERLKKLEALYARYDNDSFAFDYDEKTANYIKTLQTLFEGRNYTDFSNQELEMVLDMVKSIRTQIANTNKLLNMQTRENAREAAKEANNEIKASRKYKNKVTQALNKYVDLHLNAQRWFRKVSGYKENGALMEAYKMIDDGLHKEMQIQRNVNEIFKDVLLGKENQKELKKLTSTKKEDLVDIGIKDENGKPVLVTRDMRLSVIMHSYNESNLRHMLDGGFRIPNLNEYQKNKIKDSYGDGKNYRYIPYSVKKAAYKQQNMGIYDAEVEKETANIKKLYSELSEWEKAFLKATEKFLWDYSGKVINETSTKLKGYSLARVKHYFPIHVDSNFVNADVSGLVMDRTIEGQGWLKERITSGKPIYLEGLTNVILRQTKSVSEYGGMAVPIRNMNMLLNVQMGTDTLRKTITDVWSASDLDYLTNLLADIQGGRNKSESFDILRSAFAGSIFTLNASVAIRQAASYPTAAATLGYRTLAKTLVKLDPGKANTNGKFALRKGIKELEEINPLLWYRSQGYSTEELGDIKNIRGLGNAMPYWLDWISMFDIGTVRALEYASKDYVDRNFKSLEKGSEEYWQKVSDVFTKTVEETQPNYTVLQRAEVARRGGLWKYLVMFKTQSLQNFGIMYDAVGNLVAKSRENKLYPTDSTKAELKNAKNQFAHALTSQIMAAVVYNLMGIIAASLIKRKLPEYEDEEGNLDKDKILNEILGGSMETMAGSLVFGSELYDMIVKFFSGEKYYGTDVQAISGIEDIYTSLKTVYDAIGDRNEAITTSDKEKTKIKLLKAIEKLANNIGYVSGIPVSNLNTLLQNGFLYGEDIFTENKAFESAFKTANDIPNQKELIIDALMTDDPNYKQYINEYGKAYLANPDNEGKTLEDAAENIMNYQKSFVKKKYESDEISDSQASMLLKKIGYDSETVEETMISWRKSIAKDKLGDSYTMDQYIDAVESYGISDEKEYSAIKTELKKKYDAGEISDSKAISYFKSEFGMTDDEAYWQLNKWKYDNKQYAELENLVSESVKTGKIDGTKLKSVIDEYKSHGKEGKDIPKLVTSDYKEDYLAGNNKANIYATLLNVYRISYGCSQEEAKKKLNKLLHTWYKSK